MATTTFLSNATFLLGATDLSDQCRSVTLTVGNDQLETTAMGSTGHTFTGGLQTVDVSVEMFLSYGATEVEATLAAALNTQVTLTISPSGTSESATNPEYTITNAFLANYTPIASSVGELAMVTATFTGGTFARDITP
jgi:hypothetical protein